MIARQINGGVLIDGVEHFSVKHTFDCGQCFRWDALDDKSYVGVAFSQAARISADDNSIFIKGINLEQYENVWKRYLDLGRDYGKIKNTICYDSVMLEATNYGWGIRILRQEFFETLISFIISQRNAIFRIKGIVKRLCEKFGNEIAFDGQIYYSFPSAQQLKNATEADYAALGMGYRAKYVYEAVQKVLTGEIDGEELEKMDTATARKELLKIYGVGNKVADCVLLFSLAKFGCFPVDVWMDRVMHENYIDGKENAIAVGEERFGEYSGFAQQYLFYWRRDKGRIKK